MKNILLLLGGLFLLVLLASCTTPLKIHHKKQSQIPLNHFFKNPQVTKYSISPNGKFLAFLKPYKKRMNIFVQDINQLKPAKRITNQLDRNITQFFWKENETILFLRDFGGDENYHLFRVSTDGSDEQDLTPFKETRVNVVDPLQYIDPNHILINLNKRDKRAFDVYRIHIKTGQMKMIVENSSGHFTSWLVDHKGRLRIATSTDGANKYLYYRDSGEEKFKRVLTIRFKDRVLPLFFTFDNKKIYALSNLNRDKLALVILDPKAGRETEVIYERTDVDVEGRVSYSKKRKSLIHAIYTTWRPYYKFFDRQWESIYRELSTRLPHFKLTFPSLDREEKLLIVRASSDKIRGTYYIYNIPKKELRKIGEMSPWLPPSEMAEMKPIQYKSRDGLTINGYLTLPRGGQKNLPTVVFPHGGPWRRDVWRYSSTVQFLANRGYAVLQMNFRGSRGYGRKFWTSSFKKWGKEIQNDITDGVHYLIRQGIADKDRVGIFGASYGGYIVLAGLAFTPDLYACGVDYVGISNIFTYLKSIPPYLKPLLEALYQRVGHPEKDKALLTEVSPVFHANKIKAPLMVVHGANDPRVKKSESDQIVAALKKKGIDVIYLVKENEGHGFTNEENKIEMYSKMEQFFKHCLLKDI